MVSHSCGCLHMFVSIYAMNAVNVSCISRKCTQTHSINSSLKCESIDVWELEWEMVCAQSRISLETFWALEVYWIIINKRNLTWKVWIFVCNCVCEGMCVHVNMCLSPLWTPRMADSKCQPPPLCSAGDVMQLYPNDCSSRGVNKACWLQICPRQPVVFVIFLSVSDYRLH